MKLSSSNTTLEICGCLVMASPPTTGLSLKARGLKHLAAREHSRVELERKLAPHAESAEALAEVLDEFEQRGWLSVERFVASVVHRKAARYGVARIRVELAQHRLPEEAVHDAVAALKDTEMARAHAVWLRRFGGVADTPEARLKQMRFLAGRGFSSEVIRRIVDGRISDDVDR